MRILAGGLCAFLLAALIPRHPLEANGSCGDLAALALPHGAITLAQEVKAGAFTPPDATALPVCLSRRMVAAVVVIP